MTTPRKPDRRPLSDADYQDLADFRHALRSFVQFSERAARDAGITPNQHQLLLAIRGHPGKGAPSLSDVAERLMIQLHSAGELADRAVAHGLVQRLVDPDDHRRVRLELTEVGAAKLAELSLLHRDELQRFRSRLLGLLDGAPGA